MAITFDELSPTFDTGGSTWDGFEPVPSGISGVLNMAQFSFGAGVLWGVPLSDSAGNAIANPTPVNFGALQDVSLDISSETKMLHGSNQFPIAIGRGKGKISGKAKAAQINGALFNSIFFGQTLTAGIIGDVFDTSGALIPTTPFTITPTVPSSGTWTLDLGVRDTNGDPLTRVASAPATGQYSVAAGVYTFAAADTGLRVFISFQYTAASTSSKRSTIVNQLMGYAPTFRCELFLPYQGKQLVITLPNCIATKLGFATKLDDFMIPEFDFEAFADGSGNIMTYSTSA